LTQHPVKNAIHKAVIRNIEVHVLPRQDRYTHRSLGLRWEDKTETASQSYQHDMAGYSNSPTTENQIYTLSVFQLTSLRNSVTRLSRQVALRYVPYYNLTATGSSTDKVKSVRTNARHKIRHLPKRILTDPMYLQ